MNRSNSFLILLVALCFSLVSYAEDQPYSVFHQSLASDGHTTVSNKGGKLRYSRDGNHTWTNLNHCGQIYNIQFNSVKFIEETKLFIAVGYYHPPGRLGKRAGVFCFSSDGINWVNKNIPGNHSIPKITNLNDVAYGNGYYMVVGESSDGVKENRGLVEVIKADNFNNPKVKWKIINTLLNRDPINSVIFATGNFVAAANNSRIYIFSPPDASGNWEPATAQQLSGTVNFNQLIYVDDNFNGVKTFVVIGDNSTTWYSPDGVNWEEEVGDQGTSGHANFNQIVYLNHKFLIAADENTIWTSGNGISWTPGNGLSGQANLDLITYAAPWYTVTGAEADGKEVEWHSITGDNWARSQFPFLNVKNSGGYNMFVCTDPQGDQKAKCSSEASLGQTITLDKDLQPQGGMKSGGKICVAVITGAQSYTNFYFELQQNAVFFANSTILQAGGTFYSPYVEKVSGIKLINVEKNVSDACKF